MPCTDRKREEIETEMRKLIQLVILYKWGESEKEQCRQAFEKVLTKQ